jgi:hypothetical protein
LEKFVVKIKTPLGDGNYGTMSATVESEEIMIDPASGNLMLIHHETRGQSSDEGELFSKVVVDFYASADSVVSCGKLEASPVGQ